MPVERIKKLLAKKGSDEATSANNEAEKRAALYSKRQREMTERRAFVAQKTEMIVKSSGVLEGLRRINEEVLEGAETGEHRTFYLPEEGRAGLVWGSKFKIEEGEVRPSGMGSRYSYVLVEVNADTDSLTVTGAQSRMFYKKDWEKPEIIEEALAYAYVYPRTYEPHEWDNIVGGGGGWG